MEGAAEVGLRNRWHTNKTTRRHPAAAHVGTRATRVFFQQDGMPGFRLDPVITRRPRRNCPLLVHRLRIIRSVKWTSSPIGSGPYFQTRPGRPQELAPELLKCFGPNSKHIN